METSKLKNMVILRNLPSNMIEEAIIILKSSAKMKNLQKVDNSKKIENEKKVKKDNNYVLKEAEMIVTNYITQIERQKNKKETERVNTSKSYKRLKNYAYISSFIIFLQALMLFTN